MSNPANRQLHRSFSRRNLSLLATVASILGVAASTTGAPAEKVADAPGGLEEIVVTATRHEETLSKVPLSLTAITQEGLDLRGIKDIQDVARFTPGINVDNTGTNNISIRGIASTGGAGTTGIYIDDTPIQMRALAFNPDEALPKSFDIDRVEVLRGPQGTLFGAGSMGGTVRYITTPPSLSKSSIYSRSEVSFTRGGDPGYEAGIAAGGPLVDGKFGARITAWYRQDGGWIDRVDPFTMATVDKRSNHTETALLRLAGVWAVNDHWTVTPSIYYQDSQQHDVGTYWQALSDPSSHRFINGNPTQRTGPDTFYLPALKIEGDVGSARLISNTSYYHRNNITPAGYDGTIYNLGFYQSLFLARNPNFPLFMDGKGFHLDQFGLSSYRAPSEIHNGQQNFTQEIRLQSADANARFTWTTGLFYSSNKQTYLEQLNDPQLNSLLQAAYPLAGLTAPAGGDYITDFFGIGYDPNYPTASYFLKTSAKDEQLAWFGEGVFGITDNLKATVGARFSKTKFSFETLTGGPQLFGPNSTGSGDQKENSFTPKLGLSYQHDPNNLYYVTYAKGFRPGGANNPVPYAACAQDFQSFGIPGAPQTFQSDSLDSYEVGAKNNFNNRIRIASSVYYIKWKNIQQVVLPPICQITFIANLGEATAKGADLQAEFAVTSSFTVELSAGYTDARYTKDSKFSSAQPTPVVAAGDAIVGQSGQPGAPVTASLGLEYKFEAFGRESFVRADYQYEAAPKWASASQDGRPSPDQATCLANASAYANTLQYDCSAFPLPSTNFVTIRGGMNFGAWSVAAFVENLTDSHTLTNYLYSINPGTGSDRLRRDFTFRPRTIGLTFTYRQ